jgi:drug/metabolite transporter (DMT)-like permease
MFIRLVSVAIMCMPFLLYCGIYIAKKDWLRLLLVSCIGIFGYFLGSIFGFQFVKAGIGSIIIAVQPLIVASIAAALGAERLSAAVLVGLLVSLAGSILLFSGDAEISNFNRDTIFGIAMLMLCNVCFAINIVFSKPLVQTYGAMRVTMLTMILAALPALAFYRPGVFGVIAAMDAFSWWSLFFLGFVGTILVVIIWNHAVGQLPTNTVGASLYVIPILGTLSGWLVLGETLTWQAIAGGAVVLAGVAFSEFAKFTPRDLEKA